MRNVTIVFFDAGGGHRNAAEALKSALTAQKRPWEVRLLNLQELLDSLDIIRRATGIRLQDGYNLILRKGWTRPTRQLLPLLRGLVRLYHSQVVRVLETYWSEHPTDLVLSVIPLFNRALAESILEVLPSVPFVTCLTDLADTPPHFWIEQESEYLICGTERAKQQALDQGHHPRRVFGTSGMVMKPKFYCKISVDRVAERKRLGLGPTLPTGVVLFGGHGAPVMMDIVKQLDACPDDLQLIALCGHNQKLLATLKEMSLKKCVVVQGFTSEIDYYMALGDFFIGKPGPGSISEALQFDLPVIVECNGSTMPQERYNAEWVKENRVGIVLHSFKEVAAGVHQLLEKRTFDEFRANARAYSNRALFEIPAILDEVSHTHVPQPMAVPTPFTSVGPMGQDAAWAGSN